MGEGGIADVPVTDGLSFVKTDTGGRYRIDAQSDPLRAAGSKPLVAITIPTGHWPTAGWFRRIAEASDRDKVDFGLRRDDQRTPFVFIHGTDCHVPRGGEGLFPMFREDVRRLGETVKFCVLTGDLAHLPDREPQAKGLADYALFAKGAADFPRPLFCTLGNHDVTGYNAPEKWDRRHPLYGYGAFTHYVGPLRWSFNYAGYHFVGLDFMDRQKGRWARRAPPHAVTWLERDLAMVAQGTPVLLFIHHQTGLPNRPALYHKHGVRHIFAGHSHADRASSYAGVPAAESGSLSQAGGGRRPGYRLVRVTPEGLETFYRATGDEHAITLDQPRGDGPLGKKVTVRGGFFDVDGKIKRLTVRVGNAGGTVTFQRTPLCCRFQTDLDLSDVPAGFRRLEVCVTDGTKAWRYARNCLVLSGHDAKFEPSGDAELQVSLAGVDRSVEVLVNGETLKPLGPTRVHGDGPFRPPIERAQTVVRALPRGRLKRLNAVELRAGKHADGRPDVFVVCDVRISYDGKTSRDTRLPHGRRHGATVRTHRLYHIDLMPDAP